MRKTLKKMTAAACLGTVVLTLVPTASLAEAVAIPVINQQESAIAPYMLYISDWQSKLTIVNRIAKVDCWVNGSIDDATKAKVVAELQEKSGSSWSTIATWTDTRNDYEAFVYETKSVTAGKTYRVKATITVWEGTKSETQTVYSEEKTA
ncbi:MAG: hypothetical protein ACLUKQ_01230 [Peptococcaceae bacterium]